MTGSLLYYFRNDIGLSDNQSTENKPVEKAEPKKDEERPGIYDVELFDGVTNVQKTNEQLTVAHNYEDITITNVTLQKFGDLYTFTGDVKNNTNIRIEVVEFSFVLLNEAGEEITHINGAAGGMDPKGSSKILTETYENIIDAADYKIVARETK